MESSGAPEAHQSYLDVKGTSTEFDIGSFVQKKKKKSINQLKRFRTFGQIWLMLMVVSFSLFIRHNGHIYQGSPSSESQLCHLGPSWLLVNPNKIHLSN